MQTVGEMIRELRLDRGMTLSAVAEAIGSTKSYLSMIENHRVAKPPSVVLLKGLEAVLGVTDGRLHQAGDWERSPQAVRQQVQELSGDVARGRELARFIQESAAGRRGGGRNLDELYRSGELRRRIERTLGTGCEGGAGVSGHGVALYRVPLVNKVAAGYPTGFTDLDYPARVADDYLSSPGLDDPDAFAATVIGESMMPDYREGDIVVFSPAAEVSDGCDCFVRLEPDHETTFKRVYFYDEGASVRLQPLNPKFPSSVYGREQVAGLYRAVFRYSKV
jgi:repressor LexA